MSVSVCAFTCLHVHMCMDGWMDEWMYAFTYLHMCVCIYVCLYVNMHACMYVYLNYVWTDVCMLGNVWMERCMLVYSRSVCVRMCGWMDG